MAEAPIALYLDLKDGEVADLEVVARAALAWSAALKELAFALDPMLEVRIELASGTPGSLSLNSIVRSLRDTVGDRATVRAIALSAVGWLLVHGAEYAYEKLLDQLTRAHEPKVEHHEGVIVVGPTLTPEEEEEIAARVVRALENDVASAQMQQLFRELERDPAVTGVGVTQTPGERPSMMVPRGAFPAMAGHGEVREQTITRRIIPERARVALIRPVLVQSDRRWGFRSAQGEFGATIKDKEFLERVLTGSTPVPMVAGLELDVDLETVEEFQNGVWTPVERNVLHVISLHQPARQQGLPFPPGPADEVDDSEE